MAKRTPRRRRHSPCKRPVDKFVDGMLDMLDSTLSTLAFGVGAVLLGRALGVPARRDQVAIPAGVPPEVKAAWDQLGGIDAGTGGNSPKRRSRKAPPQPELQPPIQLVKGEDGVYRPKGKE